MQYKKKYINDKILEAGLAEYLDKGFRQANISAIAQNAGVPVGNLYRYFDGKAGLLDALVKNTYHEVPKIVEQLARSHVDTGLPLSETLRRLTKSLSDLCEERGKGILVLADKCVSTRYEDFSDKIIEQVGELIYHHLYADEEKMSRFMSTLMAKALVHSMFDILRLNLSRAETETMVLKTMRFYFCEIETRK